MTPGNAAKRISDLLHRLGVTENYAGFSCAVCAVQLSMADFDRLRLITKLIYPEVAKQCRTTAQRVERNIRTVSDAAWKNNPSLLIHLAGYLLDCRPTNSRFLAILAGACSQDNHDTSERKEQFQ